MSFIVTLYIQEGIVMSNDSRLTVNRIEQLGNQREILDAVLAVP